MSNKQKILANMHTFTVVARLLSFTKAADELFLTQGAVSHRIKNLEEQLGFSLFVRLTRQLKLTPEGERLQLTLNHSFELIFDELDDIHDQELSGELHIGTSPYFAMAWLIPRLSSFQALYPNLNIKLQASEDQSYFQFSALDIGIYYSKGEYPDCFSQRLFTGQRLPVCTPEYAQAFNLYGNIEHLSQVNFIHSSSTSVWKQWLKKNALTLDCTKKQYLFTHNNLTIDAAKNGIGIAMGRLEFLRDELKSGVLVAPFEMMESGKGYDLVCPQGLQKRAKFQAFSKWVLSQI